jgi:hypothetical protein
MAFKAGVLWRRFCCLVRRVAGVLSHAKWWLVLDDAWVWLHEGSHMVLCRDGGKIATAYSAWPDFQARRWWFDVMFQSGKVPLVRAIKRDFLGGDLAFLGAVAEVHGVSVVSQVVLSLVNVHRVLRRGRVLWVDWACGDLTCVVIVKGIWCYRYQQRCLVGDVGVCLARVLELLLVRFPWGWDDCVFVGHDFDGVRVMATRFWCLSREGCRWSGESDFLARGDRAWFLLLGAYDVMGLARKRGMACYLQRVDRS